jgi:hypothetical protein
MSLVHDQWYASTSDEIVSSRPCGDEDGAIMEAENMLEEDDAAVAYVGQACKHVIGEIDPDWILERMQERYYDICRCDLASEWPGATKKQIEDLGRRLDLAFCEWFAINGFKAFVTVEWKHTVTREGVKPYGK